MKADINFKTKFIKGKLLFLTMLLFIPFQFRAFAKGEYFDAKSWIAFAAALLLFFVIHLFMVSSFEIRANQIIVNFAFLFRRSKVYATSEIRKIVVRNSRGRSLYSSVTFEMENSKTTHNYDWISEESMREFVENLKKMNIETEIVDPLNKF
jgi:hypothetical protein